MWFGFDLRQFAWVKRKDIHEGNLIVHVSVGQPNLIGEIEVRLQLIKIGCHESK